MTSETRYFRNDKQTTASYPSSDGEFASGYNLVTGTLTSGTVAKLQADDGDYMVFTSVSIGGSPNQEKIEVEFSGELLGHLPFLQFIVDLKLSIACTLTIAVYDYAGGHYESSGTMWESEGVSVTTDITRYLYSILSNTDFREAATKHWKVKITALATTPNHFTMSVDYLTMRAIYYPLSTTDNTGMTAAGNDSDVCGITLGIRVWKVKADDSEEDLAGGLVVATVVGPDSTTNLSGTWPIFAAVSDCVAIVVRLYASTDVLKTGDLHAGGVPLVFMTEDLNTTLQNVTWTVDYYFRYFGPPIDETYFFFGSTTRNSRIENFTYGAAVVKTQGDGLTWVVA